MTTPRFLTGAFAFVLSTLWLFAPGPTLAFETATYIMRSIEDPSVVPDLTVCDAASFVSTAILPASFYAVQTRASDGQIVNGSVRKIGQGTACARITSLGVGAVAPIIGSFEIGDQEFIGEGACVVSSNSVPTGGLIMVGCTIPLSAGPGVLGGVATSNSIFNPFGLPGFDTGSIWTVRVFTD